MKHKIQLLIVAVINKILNLIGLVDLHYLTQLNNLNKTKAELLESKLESHKKQLHLAKANLRAVTISRDEWKAKYKKVIGDKARNAYCPK